MEDSHFSTPILFIIFNRPDTARAVFEEIRKIRPKRLFVAADGPRPSRPDDIEKCQRTKEILKGIDWDCELKTFFRESNVGCGLNVAESISWFFSHVDKGIIMEDDIIPHPEFFPFCTQMLERYENDESVAAINGFYGENIPYTEDSYFFRTDFSGWGWATWKRVWDKFDFFLRDYSRQDLKNAMRRIHAERKEWLNKKDQYLLTRQGKADSWDWQFRLYLLKWNSFVLTPRLNMVKCIGYGDDSSHFKGQKAPKHIVYPIFPLRHPEKVECITPAYNSRRYTVAVRLPGSRHSFMMKKNFIWWTWRWFRRNFIASTLYSPTDNR
ncbi:nucleotide-diphospho-sugar transferase [bacterium]|nr:nucleotide-diphospho-sugar transferase [bacterium]